MTAPVQLSFSYSSGHGWSAPTPSLFPSSVTAGICTGSRKLPVTQVGDGELQKSGTAGQMSPRCRCRLRGSQETCGLGQAMVANPTRPLNAMERELSWGGPLVPSPPCGRDSPVAPPHRPSLCPCGQGGCGVGTTSCLGALAPGTASRGLPGSGGVFSLHPFPSVPHGALLHAGSSWDRGSKFSIPLDFN